MHENVSPKFILLVFYWNNLIINVLCIIILIAHFSDLKAQSIGASYARLSWQRPWDDGGRAQIKYTLYCQECHPPREYTTFGTNFTITRLLPKTQYTFRVYALNSVSPYFHDISFKELMIETTEEGTPIFSVFVNFRKNDNLNLPIYSMPPIH